MEYTSQIADMLHNPQHPRYSDECFNTDLMTYVLKDSTIYAVTNIWDRDFRRWLETYGIIVPDNRRLYTPIGKLENGKIIGYNTQFANMGNTFLEMVETTRDNAFSNLYFVEVGNHPYPKVARYRHTWLIDNYHRDCHILLNPPTDPKKFFILPKDLVP